MTTVSIIIPAYQAEQTIKRALISVKEQTYEDFEVIVVNDGSTDQTISMAKSIVCTDKRFRIISQSNQGPSSARNTGIKQSNGRYLAFLDADDEWLPLKLEKQVQILNIYKQIDVLPSNSTDINVEDNTIFDYSHRYSIELNKLKMSNISDHPNLHIINKSLLRCVLYEKNFIHTSSVMLRKGLFDRTAGFNSECKGGEDLDLWLRLAKFAQFAYLDEICAKRFKSKQSLSYRSEEWLTEQLHLHQLYINSPEDVDLHSIALQNIRSTYTQFVKLYGRSGYPAQAIRYFKQSLRWGFNPKTALYAYGSLLGPTPFILAGKLYRQIKHKKVDQL